MGCLGDRRRRSNSYTISGSSLCCRRTAGTAQRYPDRACSSTNKSLESKSIRKYTRTHRSYLASPSVHAPQQYLVVCHRSGGDTRFFFAAAAPASSSASSSLTPSSAPALPSAFVTSDAAVAVPPSAAGAASTALPSALCPSSSSASSVSGWRRLCMCGGGAYELPSCHSTSRGFLDAVAGDRRDRGFASARREDVVFHLQANLMLDQST